MAEHVTKVFISATSKDLRTVRQLVRDALLNMGCLPVVQEHFGPDYRDVSGMLRDKIAGCDALIHIAGLRYGAEPDLESLPEGKPRRSYTQMELDFARDLKLEKVFTFVCPEEFPYDSADESGEPLSEEPADLHDLQQKHRERLLKQKELRYRANSPEELATQVREIQLELREVKGQLAVTRAKMLRVGAVIAVTLVVIGGGVFWILNETGGLKREQSAQSERLELSLQAPRVLEAYQIRFRVIRDAPDREVTLTNHLIDKMVRAELPGIVELQPDVVTRILEIEAPRLAAEVGAPIELKLAALFALGEYDATLEQGERHLVNPTIEALKTMGDAALAKFEKRPEQKLRQDAIRYYSGSLALIRKDEAPEDWALVAMLLADVYRETGSYNEAEPLHREALGLRERVLGREHPDTLISIHNLAGLLSSQGKYEGAETLYRKSLEIRLRVMGREHPDTLSSINNLALLLSSQGKYEEAELLFREALESFERVLGREHPDTLSAINNLALLLSSKGKYEDAEPLYREALESFERALGREHPDTLRVINNLAALLESQGKYEDAEFLYREALKTSERVLGRDHPDTLRSIHNMAGLLSSQGDYEGAEPLYRESLEASERVLGRGHPNTLFLISSLAVFLERQGNYEDAEPLNREVLETRTRVLGRAHPDTLTSINNQAGILESLGKIGDAELLYREALETNERVLGREHPDTLRSINNLAFLLKGQGEYDEAAPLYLEALETSERVLGRAHPDTLIAINNLAGLLRSQKKYEEAEPLHREALETSERVLGREHPNTLVAINNLAFLLSSLEKYEEATPLFRDAMRGFVERVGWEHPHTQHVKGNFLRFFEEKTGSADAARAELISVLETIDSLAPEILDEVKATGRE